MGTKVQVDSYLPGYPSMRDLNHSSDGTSWASFYGESGLSNGQYYCSPLPRPASDSLPGPNKDILKQTIMKHEVTFKNQVLELHRLYRVQKDLMDEITRKEQYEASSSNTLFPSQMVPVSVPDIIQSSAGSNLKGKSIRASSSPLQKSGSPKESEASESRPTKVRRMIDLELMPDEYIDIDEVEQQGNRAAAPDSGKNMFLIRCENTEYQTDASRSDSCSRKPIALADLNEPLQSEEMSADPSVNFFGAPKQNHLSKDHLWKSTMNGTVSNIQYGSKGNGHHWLSSAMKEDGNKDSGRSIVQANHLGKASMSPSPVKSSHQTAGIFANAGFTTFDRTRSFSVYSNAEAALASQLPPYIHSSDLANSRDPSWGRPNSSLSQKPSSVRSNEFLGNPWHVNSRPQLNPGFTGESSVVQNGVHQGSSSGFKELPAQLCKAAPACVNGSYNNKASSLGPSSREDFNLNVLPDCFSSEVKQEDPLSVPPWLRPKAGTSTSEAPSGRGGEVAQIMPLSREKEFESGSQKGLLDINVPCEESEDFDNPANMSETVVREEKEETGRSSVLLNNIDLNSCVMEDEIIPSMSGISTELVTKAPVIDLEAPVDLETEEELPLESPPRDSTDSTDEECATVAAEAIVAIGDSTDSTDEECATVAAEAIVAISSIPADDHVSDASGSSDDALAWFVEIACSSPDRIPTRPDGPRDCLSIEPDYFEEMTLKMTECTIEEYFPSPPVFDIPIVEETNPANVPGRTRRGPARRGRQKRDFQRDILPGLASLARPEVTEDLQIFGGLMRATGHDWSCGNRRNGSRIGSKRGRKKSVVEVLSPPPPSAVKNGEIVMESRSLTSWGKTTRRPRRQRCSSGAAGNLAPIVLT